MSYPLINPSHQFFDTSGFPLVSGTLEFRDPTTNSLIKSFPTADDADAQTNENANPLTLDSRGGYTGLYLEDGVKYKVILKDSAGATVTTQDDVRCPPLAGADIVLVAGDTISGDDNSTTVIVFTDSNDDVQVLDPSVSQIIAITDDYTFLLADKGKTASRTGSTASVVVTIPAESSIDYRLGTFLGINNDGTDAITISITTDTLTWADDNTTGSRTLGVGGYAVAQKVADGKWKIAGKQIT